MPPVEIEVESLAREIAFRLAPDALLDATDVAHILGCQPRYVTEHYGKTPGFPGAIRLPGPNGNKGHPRWIRAEIAEWIRAQRAPDSKMAKKPGRPRRIPEP